MIFNDNTFLAISDRYGLSPALLLAYLAECVRCLTGAPLDFRSDVVYDTGMKRASIELVSNGGRPERRVIFLVLPSVQLLDLAGPVQVFDTAMRVFAVPYSILFCAASD